MLRIIGIGRLLDEDGKWVGSGDVAVILRGGIICEDDDLVDLLPLSLPCLRFFIVQSLVELYVTL